MLAARVYGRSRDRAVNKGKTDRRTCAVRCVRARITCKPRGNSECGIGLFSCTVLPVLRFPTSTAARRIEVIEEVVPAEKYIANNPTASCAGANA